MVTQCQQVQELLAQTQKEDALELAAAAPNSIKDKLAETFEVLRANIQTAIDGCNITVAKVASMVPSQMDTAMQSEWASEAALKKFDTGFSSLSITISTSLRQARTAFGTAPQQLQDWTKMAAQLAAEASEQAVVEATRAREEEEAAVVTSARQQEEAEAAARAQAEAENARQQEEAEAAARAQAEAENARQQEETEAAARAQAEAENVRQQEEAEAAARAQAEAENARQQEEAEAAARAQAEAENARQQEETEAAARAQAEAENARQQEEAEAAARAQAEAENVWQQEEAEAKVATALQQPPSIAEHEGVMHSSDDDSELDDPPPPPPAQSVSFADVPPTRPQSTCFVDGAPPPRPKSTYFADEDDSDTDQPQDNVQEPAPLPPSCLSDVTTAPPHADDAPQSLSSPPLVSATSEEAKHVLGSASPTSHTATGATVGVGDGAVDRGYVCVVGGDASNKAGYVSVVGGEEVAASDNVGVLSREAPVVPAEQQRLQLLTSPPPDATGQAAFLARHGVAEPGEFVAVLQRQGILDVRDVVSPSAAAHLSYFRMCA